jgi:hypothetical protein
VREVFPNGVRRAFIPGSVGQRLLRRQDFHKTAREMVKFICARNMPVQRRGIKLRQNVDAPEPGIDAVGNRDVHQPVFSRQRHRWLGAVLGQRKEPRALATPHDDT